MGPPATATRWTEVGPSASWVEAVEVEQEVAKPLGPGVRPLKGFTRHKLRERLSKQRVKGAVKIVQSGGSHLHDPQLLAEGHTVEVRPRGSGPRHKSSGGVEGRRRMRGCQIREIGG